MNRGRKAQSNLKQQMASSINGELLKAARLRRGLSLATWARELMVSETQLRSLEDGEDRGFYNDSHRVQVALKFAAALGVDSSALLGKGLSANHKPKFSHERTTNPKIAAATWKQQALSLAMGKAGQGTEQLRRWQLSGRSKQAHTEYWLAGAVLAGLAVWFSIDAWQHHRSAQRSDPLAVVQQRLDDPPSAINARPVELAKGGRVDLALAKPSEPDYPQPFVTKPNDSNLQGSSKNNSAGDRQLLKSENKAKNAEPSASLNKDRVQDKSNNRDADQVLNNGQARSSSQDRFGFSGKELRYPDRKALAEASTQGLQTSQSGQVMQGTQAASSFSLAAQSNGPESRNLDLCEVSDRMASVVVPVSRLKNTPYVHVASGVSQKVCVRSADGRVERLNLSANEARSIFGKAPFTVVSEQPSSVEIFYLGARVRHNGESRVLKIVDPDPIS